MIASSSRLTLALTCAAALALGACAGTSKSSGNKDAIISNALASAASDAASSGQLQNSLLFVEKLYNKNPKDPDAITAYARALRRNNRLDDATLVIQAAARDKSAPAELKAEYATLLIAKGNYPEAEQIARAAVTRKGGSPEAQHALALALTGLGKEAEAEEHFRTALLRWPDGADRTPIINNLAMNLAAQGKLKDAKEVMEMATGDALSSDTYRNNRALLSALKDEVPVTALPANKAIAAPVTKVGQEKLPAADNTKAKKSTKPKTKELHTKVKMKPIL